MNDAGESPQFYFDPETAKWHSAERSVLPKVLILSCRPQPGATAEQMLAGASSLPANVVPITLAGIPDILDDLASGRIAACVLLLSTRGLADVSLAKLVSICGKLFRTDPEFRLFVQLTDGLTFETLKAMALQKHPSASALIDSVHFSSDIRDDPGDMMRLLQGYLLELPKIRHRLTRERWEFKWAKILSVLVGAFRWLFVLTTLALLVIGASAGNWKDSRWSPWLCFGVGQLLWVSLLMLVTLGTRLTSGLVFRLTLLLGPLIYLLPMARLASQSLFLWAGFLAGVTMDVCVRSLARWRRRPLLIERLLGGDHPEPLLLGRRSPAFLANGPWIPGQIRVFVSYSEKSDWGRRLAQDLHTELDRRHVACFFAPKCIEHGSSWRHRLTTELRDATTFVQFLDDQTASHWRDAALNEHWPAVELAAAAAHQAMGGLPSVIVVCHPDMTPGALPEETHPYIRQVLDGAGDAIESSLWVVQDKEGIPETLAQELSKRYRWQAVSILPIKLAAVLELILMLPAMPLCMLGVFGSVGIWLAAIAAFAMQARGVRLLDWLLQNGYGPLALMLAAFWLGFVVRLAAASRLETWDKASGSSFGWRLLEGALLAGCCFFLVRPAHAIVTIYAALVVALGIMLGSHYMRRTLEGRGWTRS
jgi:hypothetical protein